MANVDITVENSRALRKLAVLADGLRDMSRLTSVVAEIVAESIDRQFKSGGHPQRWQPLSPVTIALKGHARPLIGKTGNLRKITVIPEAQRVRVGPSPSASAYAAIQHLGGMAGRNRKVRIPARPYLLVTDADKAEMKEATLRFFRQVGA